MTRRPTARLSDEGVKIEFVGGGLSIRVALDLRALLNSHAAKRPTRKETR